ncbi:MAG: PKD domain-containing protein, partial [Bacteroidales bacterium]|nr:PKD domain-containing protein [Bacteroidales bacterium]
MNQNRKLNKWKFRTTLKIIMISAWLILFSQNSNSQCNAVMGSHIDPIEGCETLTILFNDLSIGVNSRTWDFGDGSEISVAQNPSHSFEAGVGDTTYTVTLTIECASGTSVASRQVTVYALPVVSFDSDKSSVCAISDSVCFINNASFNGSNSYAWNFGDGKVSDLYQTCKAYSTPGTYDVSLTIINEKGCMKSITAEDFITVEPVPSTAFSVSDFSGCSPFTVEFFNITDTLGNDYTNWSWDYGDGSPQTTEFNSPMHTYTTPGTYIVTLGTTNQLGCYNYSTQIISVKPTPVSDFSFGDMVCENDSATFIFTGIYNTSPSFNWDFDSASYISTTGEGPVRVKWDTPGIKEIALTIDEAGCSSTYTDKFQVIPLGKVYVSISTDVDNICEGKVINFSALPSNFVNYKYFVNSNLVQNSPSNIYTSSTLIDNDKIYVEISDIFGCTEIISDTISFTVLSRPIVNLSSTAVSDTICLDETVTFSTIPDGYENYDFRLNNESIQDSLLNEFSISTLEDKDRIQVIATENGCESILDQGIITNVKQPLPPPQVNCGGTTPSTIEFKWDEISGAKSYTISVDGEPWQNPSSGISGISHLLTGLPATEAHTVEVRASDGSYCGLGEISMPQTCLAISCDEILFSKDNPVQLACEGENIMLSIDSINISNFQIEWDNNSEENKANYIYSANTNIIIPVSVTNLDQPGCPSLEKSFDIQVTERPVIQIDNSTGDQPVCEGTSISYTVTPANYENYLFYGNNSLLQSGPDNIYTDDGVIGNQEVYAAVIEGNCRVVSDTISISVDTPVAVPVVNYFSSDLSSIQFVWDEISGTTGYLVSENYGPFIIPSSGTLSTTHTIDNLIPGEAMSLSVIALSDGTCGMSEQSLPAIGFAESCISYDYDLDSNYDVCLDDSVVIEIKNLSISNYGISWAQSPETSDIRHIFIPEKDTIISVTLYNLDQPSCPAVIKYTEIKVYETPSSLLITSSDIDNLICEGEKISFLVLPTGHEKYEFYNGFSLIEDSYFNSYETTLLEDGDEIRARAINNTCVGDFSNTIITTVEPKLPTPQVNCGSSTAASVNFIWDALTDAKGYEVSVNDMVFITPSSGNMGLTHELTGLGLGDSATISVIALGDTPCGNSMISQVTTCYARDCDLISFSIESEKTSCENETLDLVVEDINIPDYSLSWNNGSTTLDTTFNFLSIIDTIVTVSLTDNNQPGCPSVNKYFNIDVITSDPIIISSNAVNDSICDYSELIISVTPSGYDRYVFYNNSDIVQDSIIPIYRSFDLLNDNLITVEVYNHGCLNTSNALHTEIIAIEPVYLQASETGDLCMNESVSFTASPGFSRYVFTDSINELFEDSQSTVDLDVRSDMVTVMAYDDFNCVSISEDSILFNILPLTETSITASIDTMCYSDFVVFTASPSGLETYNFYNNDTILLLSSVSETYITDSLKATDNISVRGISENGCLGPLSSSQYPIIIPYPNSTISKQVEGICLYDTTSLWINIDSLFPTPLNYYWSTGETTDTILVNPNI